MLFNMKSSKVCFMIIWVHMLRCFKYHGSFVHFSSLQCNSKVYTWLHFFFLSSFKCLVFLWLCYSMHCCISIPQKLLNPKIWCVSPEKEIPSHGGFSCSLRLIRDVCVERASLKHVWKMLSSLKEDVWSEEPLGELWMLTLLALISSKPVCISTDRHNTALNDLCDSLSFSFSYFCIINGRGAHQFTLKTEIHWRRDMNMSLMTSAMFSALKTLWYASAFSHRDMCVASLSIYSVNSSSS